MVHEYFLGALILSKKRKTMSSKLLLLVFCASQVLRATASLTHGRRLAGRDERSRQYTRLSSSDSDEESDGCCVPWCCGDSAGSRVT